MVGNLSYLADTKLFFLKKIIYELSLAIDPKSKTNRDCIEQDTLIVCTVHILRYNVYVRTGQYIYKMFSLDWLL